jgi:uncharacterized protein
MKYLKYLIILPVQFYQIMLSPMLGASKCRYNPTCSHYMIAAVQEWGIFKGTWLGLKRIGRCHPYSKTWGYDPVPKK